MYFVIYLFSCLWISSSVVDNEDDNEMTKDILGLTFVTSDQSVSEVKSLGCNHDNLTSSYHISASMKVPIAEAESDFEIPDNEDDDDVEEEEKDSQVNMFTFGSTLL